MTQVAVDEVQAAPAAVALPNPAPLGLNAFALTTFVLSAQAAGFFKLPHIVLGLAVFFGGAILLIAGVQAFRVGNTFAGTVFGTYSGLWFSFAVIFIPGFGVLGAYLDPKTGSGIADFNTAVGFYMLAWTIATALLLIVSLRTNWALITIFILAFVALFLFAIGYLLAGAGSADAAAAVLKMGGYAGILLAISGWYACLAFLLGEMGGPFTLPVGPR